MVEKGQATRASRKFVTQIDVQLPNRISAPAAARKALDELESEISEEVFQDVVLLANELVTNSIRHAGIPEESMIGIKVGLSQDAVRVEVSDNGPGFEAAGKGPSKEQTSGWGLHLVNELSDRWGNDQGDSSRVWFEINY